MTSSAISRRRFLTGTGALAGLGIASANGIARGFLSSAFPLEDQAVDYTLHIKTSAIEIAPKRIISAITYNGQFPGSLLRFKEGRQVTVDVYNDTETLEQLHWHGQKVPVDVDGAAEEGIPYIPPHGKRQIAFTPNPSGFRFYHTHNRAGANLAAGQYGGEVGPVYIEPAQEPGRYDREVFLVLKEFEPTFSRGGDMPQDFLSPGEPNKELKEIGESSMKASLATLPYPPFRELYSEYSLIYTMHALIAWLCRPRTFESRWER